MSEPKDKPTVEECLRFVEDYLAEIKLNTEKFGIDYGRDIAILQAIRKHLTESDIAHWMDRCHELEVELAEVRRRTSDKEGM